MTQARDVADGKFTNNVLTVSSADNIVGSFESTDAVQWIAMQDSDTSSGTHVMLGAIGDDLRFRAGNNEVGRWLSGGGLAFNGDTAQVNALDDYEEGTWTPANASADSVTITVQSAFYRKVGSLVAVQAYIIFPTTSGSSAATVSGLPYNGVAGAGSYGAFTVGYSDYTADFRILKLVPSNGNFDFRVPAGGGNLTNANLSGKSIIFSGVYAAA